MTDTNHADTIHKFEAAGLGRAPFKVLGCFESKYQACHGAPVQPGSSCDYCGNGIMQVFRVRGADGREFKVGCDCVLKAGDEGMRRVVNRMVADARNAARHAREADEHKVFEFALASPEFREILARIPHPMGFEGTALTWATWTLRNAGARGIGQALKFFAGSKRTQRPDLSELSTEDLRAVWTSAVRALGVTTAEAIARSGASTGTPCERTDALLAYVGEVLGAGVPAVLVGASAPYACGDCGQDTRRKGGCDCNRLFA